MKKTIFILAILMWVSACNESLVEDPKAVAVENFYNTAEELEAAVYAAYYPLLDGTLGAYLVNVCEVDYGEGRATFANYSDFKGDLINDSRIPSAWTGWYRAIRNANLVIKNAPESTAATEEQVKQYIAEAKFVRAYSYFSLVRNWGAVPLRNEDNMVELNLPRSPKDDIYAFILSDLEYAETNLPESQALAGRADKYAAKAVLADVYMDLGRWTDARSKTLDIINSDKYALIKVNTPDDFYKIFGADIVRTSEEIFYIKSNIDRMTMMARYRHHPNFPYCNFTGVYAIITDSIKNKAIKGWDYHDLRKKFMLYNVNIGLGASTMLFKKYNDYNANGIYGKNDWPAYRYPDMLLIYAEADCRANNGPTADGMEKLNMVHRRAYGKDPGVASDFDYNLSDYNKDTFIDLVLKEGLYEQMDEGKRKFSLIRTGKLKDAVKYARGIDVADKSLLWPIPVNEYLYNKGIDPTKDQNPGY